MSALRVRAVLRGAVQGVGFRPFAWRLARDLGVVGFVSNTPQGVLLEAEGPEAALELFLRQVRQPPPPGRVDGVEAVYLPPVGEQSFAIRDSGTVGVATAHLLPDLAPCGACLRELLDPADRRYRYPFINCTACGPRFSILLGLPYDRERTTMRAFRMCRQCQAEYDDPMDRRFHAQPNACPACGPTLALWDSRGTVLCSGDAALLGAAAALRQGEVVAVLGVGGFHLMVDARSEEAVRRLRARKRRPDKPFALLYPDLAAVRQDCLTSPLEERLLSGADAPIVLLRRRPGSGRIATAVAPGLRELGVMLPPAPLHYLLMRELEFPVVATSGNLSEEPICTSGPEALRRLSGMADRLLVHDRPIARPIDDSVVRVVAGRPLVLRRARGMAPLPVSVGRPLRPVLAVGAHLKSTVALARGDAVVLSQHLGDLGTPEAGAAFREAVSALLSIHGQTPAAVVHDLHPDYDSTRFAEATGLPRVAVQHHHAHVLSCLAEHGLGPPALGVAWDGMGLGSDGTLWGGEFLLIEKEGFRRAAHLRTFPLPGGDQAAREPRRAALGLLHELGHPPESGLFSEAELRLLGALLKRGRAGPRTSSAGRLFDAVASLCGVRQRATYEAQAALELEHMLPEEEVIESYPVALHAANPIVVDWGPLVEALLADRTRGVPPALLAARFHNALVEAIVAVARHLGQRRVVLTGGCFQNRYLTERAVRRLKEEGYEPIWHLHVPPGDGGIALGQVLAAAATERETCALPYPDRS
ncbi:MAG: carbamoyltransferase HypF [Myxococcota bacterium]|nr:carbamoyltransferase HypF [Myxococcota bacterium]